MGLQILWVQSLLESRMVFNIHTIIRELMPDKNGSERDQI